MYLLDSVWQDVEYNDIHDSMTSTAIDKWRERVYYW